MLTHQPQSATCMMPSHCLHAAQHWYAQSARMGQGVVGVIRAEGQLHLQQLDIRHQESHQVAHQVHKGCQGAKGHPLGQGQLMILHGG